MAEWEKLRNFATDFNDEITKRYAHSADRNLGNSIALQNMCNSCAVQRGLTPSSQCKVIPRTSIRRRVYSTTLLLCIMLNGVRESTKFRVHNKMRKITILLTAVILSMTVNAQNTGYEKSVSFFGNFGVGKYANSTYGFNMVNGYRFNQYFYLGFGVGIGYSSELSSVTEYVYLGTKERRQDRYPIPLYLQAKFNLTNGAVSPFILVNAGYTLDIKEYLKDAPGLMLNPALGVEIPVGEKQAILVSAGFKLQHGTMFESGAYTRSSLMFKSISAEIGFKF